MIKFGVSFSDFVRCHDYSNFRSAKDYINFTATFGSKKYHITYIDGGNIVWHDSDDKNSQLSELLFDAASQGEQVKHHIESFLSNNFMTEIEHDAVKQLATYEGFAIKEHDSSVHLYGNKTRKGKPVPSHSFKSWAEMKYFLEYVGDTCVA